jgi:prepilin-type N-terminal cleavage/methylation domain-containing protein/prepilin-type processing-associated H-X9-DG protein
MSRDRPKNRPWLRWDLRPGGAGRAAAFTLTELLVVISVILILAAILIPAMQSSASKARQMQCVSNLRQLSQGVRLYANDNSNRIPSCVTWMANIAPYVGQSASAPNLNTLGVFRCPAGWVAGAQNASPANQATYWYNCHSLPFAETPADAPAGANSYYYSFPSLALFNNQDQTIILACWWYFLWSGNWTTQPGDTHSSGRPTAYLDGHVVCETDPAFYQYGGPPMSAIQAY